MQKIKKKTREITLMLIIFMVLILFFTGYTLGKSFTQTEVNARGKIAKPILIVDSSNEATPITASLNKGYYDFIVKNYNENDEINDIKLLYNIEILSDLDESINIKLFKDDNEIKIENNKTEEFVLKNKEKQEDKYRIEIQYDKNASTSLEDIIQDLQIKVHSEQVQI